MILSHVLATGETQKVYVNVNNVTHISPFYIRVGKLDQMGTQFFFSDGVRFSVTETFDEVMKKINEQ